MPKKKYLVTVSRVEYHSTSVEVEAESEQAAAEAAMYDASFGNCCDAEQSIEDIEAVEQ